jgi:UDP:flavonoid glycosyltransferase YjiC (YdhE family)
MRALVVTWGPGGNLPPMLAAARLLARRGHEVTVMASGRTRGAAERMSLAVAGFLRSPDPEVELAFEAQAELIMATAAGAEIALDVRETIEDLHPHLAVVDCMLPAALAASEATATPAASLVHFLYGPARRLMLEAGGGFTTDLHTLSRTRQGLGLPRLDGGVAAWEAADLVLVAAPGWMDVDAGAPRHVVHAGPLGVDAGGQRVPPPRLRALLTFSTTVMEGQTALIDRVCAAVSGLGLHATLTLGPAVDRATLEVPEEIEVLAAADHDRLMPECSLVICHGGLGTVLRALAHGVPLLVLPLGRDQAFNAGRVEDLGAGIQIPLHAAADKVRDAIQSLLTDASFRTAAAGAAGRIAAAEPDRTAAGALERAGGYPEAG